MDQLNSKEQYGRHYNYKNTDIPWIGKVPKDWQIRKMKFNIVRNDGGVWGNDPSDEESGTIVLRSTEQSVDGDLKIENPAMRILSTSEIQKSLLEEGDLLVTKSSGSSAHIGKTSYIDKETGARKCCFSNFMQRLRFDENISSKYVSYILNNAKLGREQLDYLSQTTTGLANLNGTLLGNLLILIPPLSEQEMIAQYLDEKTELIDRIIEQKQRQIELLREYKTSLVSNAVTGRVKVTS